MESFSGTNVVSSVTREKVFIALTPGRVEFVGTYAKAFGQF
jgi:hypothetical protein